MTWWPWTMSSPPTAPVRARWGSPSGSPRSRPMPSELLTRSAPLAPNTFRREGATAYVDATITTGAEVRRSFGAERLAVTREAVTLPHAVPLRDSHRSGSIRDILGRATGFRFD